MLAREPQRAEDAAAEAVKEPRGHARDAGDRVVRAAQLAESPLERFGDVDVRRDLHQLVAGDGEAQPDARVAESFGALVDERVVDAARRARLLRLFEDRVRREVDLPVGGGALLGERAGGGRRERLRRVGAHERLGNAPAEAVRRAVGPEADRDLVDLPGLEDAHVPPVGGIGVAPDQRGEGCLASALELDVVLRLRIVRETHGAARAGRGELEGFRERFGLRDGGAARERDVEVDERDREREQPPGDDEGERREQRIGDPERRTPGHGYNWITPRAASSAIVPSFIARRPRSTSAVCSPSSGGARP